MKSYPITLRGIDCENSLGTLILCNQMNYTGVGLQLTGNNLKTRVQKNVFDHTVLGVRLRDAVMINQGSVAPPNTSYFNEWRNNYTSLDWGSRIQGNIYSLPSNWTYTPYSNDLIPCDYGTENPCNYNVTSSPTPNQFSITYVDVNSFECTSPIPGIFGYSERYDPWIDGDTIFHSQDSTGLRLLFRQNAMIELNQDSLLWTMSDSLSQKYRDWTNDLKLGYEGKIHELVNAYELGDTTLVKALHLNLPDTSLLTSLFKDLHQIYMDTWMRDSVEVDSGRVEFLYNLALNDPNKLGDVVYNAKTILGIIDSGDETRRQTFSKENISNPLKNEAIVFPNPAMNQIQIKMTENFVGEIQIQLFDISGRSQKNIQQYFESNTILIIKLEDLNTGVYLYKIEGVNFNQSGKIIKL